MRKIIKRYQLLWWTFLLLALGFSAVIANQYRVASESLLSTLTQHTLPATSEHLQAEIQKEWQTPKNLAAQVAANPALRHWLNQAEAESDNLLTYLRELKQKNNLSSVLLAAEETQQMYSADGSTRAINDKTTLDAWFVRMRDLKTSYELLAESDTALRDQLNLSVHHRLLDEQGKFIGALSMTESHDRLKRLLDGYQTRHQRQIYLIDKKGQILLSGGQQLRHKGHIQQHAGLDTLAKNILQIQTNETLQLRYHQQTETVLVLARALPELGWFMIIEANLSQEQQALDQALGLHVAIAVAITVLILLLQFFSLRRFHQQIEQSAATDTLTQLLNRQAFDFVFKQAALDAERSRQPLCVALMDIDHFKKLNDKQGRVLGDHVLKEIALIAKRSLRESDVICRWGGEEFLILLKNCALEKATAIAENLRATIEANDFSRTTHLAKSKLNVSVSMGVAEYKLQESEDSVFDRADAALSQAKDSGRNSVYFSE